METTRRLTRDQEIDILEAIPREEGPFHLYEYELTGGLTAEIWGTIHYNGYREDDYFSGTGAFVCTGVDASVNIDVWDEEGDGVEIGDLEDRVADYLEED